MEKLWGRGIPNLSGSHEGIWSRRRSELRFTWDSNIVLPSQATCQPHTSHPRTTVTWEKHKGTRILILRAEGKKEMGGEDERILKFKKDALTVHKRDDVFQRSDNKVERVWGQWGMLPGKDRGKETGTRGTQGPPGTSSGWGRRVRDRVQVSYLIQRLWRCGHDHLFLAEDSKVPGGKEFLLVPGRRNLSGWAEAPGMVGESLALHLPWAPGPTASCSLSPPVCSTRLRLVRGCVPGSVSSISLRPRRKKQGLMAGRPRAAAAQLWAEGRSPEPASYVSAAPAPLRPWRKAGLSPPLCCI